MMTQSTLKTALATTLLHFVVAGLCAPAGAQTLLDSSRRIDWSNAGVSGGIPYRTTACATLQPGATATQINSAIAGCPPEQVVQLEAGTFNLTSGITFAGKNNVTLRGAGPHKTFLYFTGDNGCMGLDANVCLKSSDGKSADNPGTVANWTGGYAKGTTTITLSTTSGLSPGMTLVLDQLHDSGGDNGQVWMCKTPNVCVLEGAASGRQGRAHTQLTRVVSVSGNNVTISPGVHMNGWRAANSPQAWWFTPIVGIGVEDLSMDHSGSGTGAYAGIFFGTSRDSWIRNVRSIKANRNHVWLYLSSKATVRDSYFYGTLNSASQSYGVESYMAADSLIENNIFERITAPMMLAANVGTVYGYNYTFDNYYYVASWQIASHSLHNTGIGMLLFEGNESTSFASDNIHGTNFFSTSFRNYWHGRDAGKTAQTQAVNINAFNRYHSFIGNVMGTLGYHVNYECAPASTTTTRCSQDANTSVWALGWSLHSGEKASTIPNDLLVKSTLMRWGNYDVVTGTRFDPAEVPSGLSLYANAVPSSQSLPASLYLPGRPAWWGSMPWPAIGPDITGGTGPGGHAHKIPARICFDQTSRTNGILNFNAYNCYGAPAAGAPEAPTNLRIIR
jgi:hypothetical protein